MKRWLPAPLLSAGLLALWLVLNRSLSPGHLLLGVLLALLAPWLFASLRPVPVRIRKPLVIARLILRVGGDVILSNLQVARGVLRPPGKAPEGQFVVVPLDLHDSHGLAALAMICCVIPGTVWSELSMDRNRLLIHVFDLGDSDAEGFIRMLKTRYERPLIEIYESHAGKRPPGDLR